jgi:transcription elongation factor GreA
MADRIPMSPAGYDKLQQDLRRMKSRDRLEIVKEIEAARAHGDISENAEFHAAKERQGHIEGRIAIIEDKLARAQVIESTDPNPDSVRFGVTVVLVDSESDEEVTYTLVGEDEADVREGLLSVSSPVARALLGKRVDDEVAVRVPKGLRHLEVRSIRFGI